MPLSSDSCFRGRSDHALDPKGRLNIPSRFREVLRHKYDDRVMVTNWHKCLKAYPFFVWEKFERDIIRQAAGPEVDSFIRYVISGVTECPLDKQGRILLPSSLRNPFKIEKDVVLAGMIDRFEIWNKEDWEEEWLRTNKSFEELSGKIAHLGL